MLAPDDECLQGERMKLGILVIATAVVSALVTASPSQADQLRITDPAGDGATPGLDIVAATVDNRDYRIITWVRFAKDVRGEVIVSVDRRHGKGLRLVSEHRPAGKDRNQVVAGAFSDKSAGPDVNCPGFRARWRDDRPVVRMSLPLAASTQAGRGDPVAILTERGDDTDYAPEDPQTGSSWVSRG